MALSVKTKFCIASLFLFMIIFPSSIFASHSNNLVLLNDYNGYSASQWSESMYIAANEINLNTPADSSADSNSESQINWHKVLGWSTLGMMAVTISSGFIVPDGIHCGLAVVTTGLAVAATADGIYEYGGLISLTDGDWRYNTHAVLAALATAGFITSLAIADGEGHVATGIASGVTFTFALGVIYF